jgi:mono/diheme cytochrome c family protein
MNLIPRTATLACCLLLAACGKSNAPAAMDPPPATAPAPLANDADKMQVPPMPEATPQSVAAGKTTFIKMNCAGCHSYTGKGWMGPDLTDSYWRYGGAPEDIYRSIYLGRPQGMPAWGKALPPEQIWQLVHYIRSLPTHPGGDPSHVSPATGTGIYVQPLPPTHEGNEAKP